MISELFTKEQSIAAVSEHFRQDVGVSLSDDRADATMIKDWLLGKLDVNSRRSSSKRNSKMKAVLLTIAKFFFDHIAWFTGFVALIMITWQTDPLDKIAFLIIGMVNIAQDCIITEIRRMKK